MRRSTSCSCSVVAVLTFTSTDALPHDDVRLQDLGERGEVPPRIAHPRDRVDHHVRQDGTAHRRRVHLDGGAADRTALPQLPDALVRRSGREAHGLAQRGIGPGGVLLELRQQGTINVIHNSPFAKILR